MKLSLSNIILAVILIALAGSLVTGFIILNRSASPMSEKQKEQALTNILGRPVVLREKKVAAGDLLHKGKYVSFLYPAAAEITRLTVNGTPVPSHDLEDFKFSLGEDPRIDVTTSILQASSAETAIADDSGVRLRQTEKDTYKQAEVVVDGQHGLVFTRVDQGFEKTAFFFINNKVYTFSVSSSDQVGATDLYNKIILSVKFL